VHPDTVTSLAEPLPKPLVQCRGIPGLDTERRNHGTPPRTQPGQGGPRPGCAYPALITAANLQDRDGGRLGLA
jgi:hypothetical protein